MVDDVVKLEPSPPGHHRVPGTDLEVVFEARGDDLVLRVNKGGVQVFRVLLCDATKDIPADRLEHYSPLSPDLTAHVGNLEEGLRRLTGALQQTPSAG
jgi:hypothetical protein